MIKTYNSAERQAGTRLVEFNVMESEKRFLAKVKYKHIALMYQIVH